MYQCALVLSYEHVATFALNPERIQSIIARNTTVAEQNAAIVQSFIDRNSSVCSWVKPVGGPIGLVQFTRAGKPVDDFALCTRILEKKGVLIVPGNKCFGDGKHFPGYVRLGFGVDANALQAGLDEISNFIKEEWQHLPLATES